MILAILLACRQPTDLIPVGTPNDPDPTEPLMEFRGADDGQLLGFTLFVEEAFEVGRPTLIASSDVAPLQDSLAGTFPPAGEVLLIDLSEVRRIGHSLEEFGRVSHVMPDTNGDGLADLVLRDNGELRLFESPHPNHAGLNDAARTWRENDLPAAHGLRKRTGVFPSSRLGGADNELFHLEAGALTRTTIGPDVAHPVHTPLDFASTEVYPVPTGGVVVLASDGWAFAEDFDAVEHPTEADSFSVQDLILIGTGEFDGLAGDDALFVSTQGNAGTIHVGHREDMLQGELHAEVALQPDEAWGVSHPVQFGDFDGDGQTDLVAPVRPGLETDTHSVAIWRGPLLQADATRAPDVVFRSPTPQPEHRFGNAIAILDFDGDGKDEIAVGSDHEGGAGAVYVYQDILAPWLAQNPHAL